jgi:hypothetical protein
MNKAASRFAYRLLLGFHPASFQDEFGGERCFGSSTKSANGVTLAIYCLMEYFFCCASVAGYRTIRVSYLLLPEQSLPVLESGQSYRSRKQDCFGSQSKDTR